MEHPWREGYPCGTIGSTPGRDAFQAPAREFRDGLPGREPVVAGVGSGWGASGELEAMDGSDGGRDGQEESERTLFFAGYAKLPSTTPSSYLYHIVSVDVVVGESSGRIFDAECTLPLETDRRFVSRLMVGRDLRRDLSTIVREIRERYHGSDQQALIAALKSVERKY
ncbi:MAG: DUF3870 domain-containing protein, partial [Firmicutes bacterium]|nr:DUF3870 domain-containing protein [Bacillota bacterium]